MGELLAKQPEKDCDDDFLSAFAKAVPDQFVEVFPERTGDMIEAGAGWLGKKQLGKLPCRPVSSRSKER